MRKGFTLIELLLVVVIIGIVASFVLPRFGDVKERAYVSNMQSDLRNSATNQEIYFADHDGYIPAASLAAEATQSADVTLGYQGDMDQNGYVLSAEHSKTSTVCVLNRTSDAVENMIASGSILPGVVSCGAAGSAFTSAIPPVTP